MNKYKIIQIISWLIVFFVLIGLVIWFLTGRNWASRSWNGYRIEKSSGSYDEVGRYDIDVSDVDSIEINWIAGGVDMIPYDGKEIELIEYAQRPLEEEEVLTHNVDSATLKIYFTSEKSNFLDMLPSKKLEIYVPNTLAGKMKQCVLNTVSSTNRISDITAEDLYLDSVSGDCELSGIKSDEIRAELTSGKMVLTDLQASQISVSSTSGRVSLKRVNADKVTADTKSGNIDLEEAIIKTMKFDTVSGDFAFTGNNEDLRGNSTSGKVEITNEAVPKSFNLDTISGDVYITMPSFEGFNLNYDTVSGDLSSDIPFIKNGSGEDNYRINTTSGDATIKEFK